MSVSVLLQPREAHLDDPWKTLHGSSAELITKAHLRDLWAKILQQDPSDFSEQDAFFEVGGDSITALDLATAAQAQGISLTVEQIFMHVTLEGMAKEALATRAKAEEYTGACRSLEPFGLLHTGISRADNIQAIGKACGVAAKRVENAYPCTPMQESLVTLSDGDENFSVRQLVYQLANDVPLDRFRQAWAATVHAHPVLRTRICQPDGELRFIQAVLDEEMIWNTSTSNLCRFLEQDAGDLMKLGDRFFRYTIVLENENREDTRRYFVWTVHHALCDAASLVKILDDVAARFHDEPTIERPPFEQFIESINRTNSSEERHFWQQTLSGVDVTPYPSVPQGSDFHVNPSSTLERPITLVDRPPIGLTRALLLRAAWGILLSHHTGTENVVFGVINSGRNSSTVPGASQMTGPTINLLPIVMQIDPKRSVASFLDSVRAQAAELMPFEQTGISKIRSYLAGKESKATDFQTVFVVHPSEFGEAAAPALQKLGLEFEDHLGKNEQHSYPMVVSATLSTDTAAKFKMQYDDRIVSTQQAHNLISQFQAVLSCLSNAKDDTLLGSISSLSDHDIAQIYQWNKITPPVNETCIHHLFEQQVSKDPDAEAVYSVEQSLTYAQVDNISSALALRLVELSVDLETYVAVCFEKSIWTVVAILAVFKAGGVYVPIDPAHPRGRIVEVVERVQIKVAITSKDSFGVLSDLCDSIVVLDNPPPSNTISLPQEIRKRAQPSNTAYLLFTSGSTGKPKGVLMSHSAMSTSIVHHGPAFGASPDWRTLQFAAHTFDISMTEFFTTLAFGGCICVPSEHDRLNNLAGVIAALRVNTALVVPTVANLITPQQVPTLKTLVLGGEPVTKETISRWAPHVNLTAGYGPSETAVYCSGHLNVAADAHPADIGRCIGGTMWIVNADNYHQLSAIGCVGEIVISGPLLGKGYLGDQATTDVAFVPAPEWFQKLSPASPYKTLYRTGDLARYNPNGTFRIVGRRDTQVKLRGFRIELSEIENRIMDEDTITAALATLPTRGPCVRQIVAVVSQHRSDLGNQGPDTIRLVKTSPEGILDKVKSRVSLTLPEYMIPSVWVVLDRMPILLSGKIDRRSIKSWIEGMNPKVYDELVGVADAAAPTQINPGTTSATIQKIWSEVLKVPAEQIGLKTSFFSLGGDSIAAIQVVSKAKGIGLSITVRGILTQKTLGNLANLVDQNQQGAPQSLEHAISPRGTDSTLSYAHVLQSHLRGHPEVKIEDSYPYTPIQREIQKQREINPAIFLLSWKMDIISLGSLPVSLDRLARAWKSVVQKHHILRSIFVKDPEGKLPPLQVVLQNAEPSIVTSSTAMAEHKPTMDELLPALDDCFLPHRAHFSQHGDRVFGHIELDHLVIDGWSFKLIKEDLLAAYDAADATIPVASSQFKSVVNAHQPARVDRDKSYWVSILRDIKPSLLSLPPVIKGSAHPPSPTKTIIDLPLLDITALSAFSAKHSITPASIFDAAWAQTLSIYTGSTDVAFEYVVSGRDQEVSNIFEIVGPVMNLLTYHLHDISTEDSAQALATLAHQMQEQRLQDGLHNACNLREVLEGDLNVTLPFNTALNFQRRPLGVQTDTLRVYDRLELSKDPWHFDVLVRVIHIMDDDMVRPSVEFDARLLDEDRMREVADVFWRKVQIAVS
ncbi:hypothetical protein AFLA70_8g006431 [Aspergillus flavus AF70]|nr:hypothetical protein AFLA70_8g006431 [Aspergillus flavus AF70]